MQPQAPQQKTPTGVTVTAVIAFIYGLFGFLCSAYGGVNAGSAADRIRAQRAMMEQMPNAPFANTAFYDDLIANAEAMMIPTIILELMAVALAVGVIYVGVLVLNRKPGALVWLPRGVLAATVFSVLMVAYQAWAMVRQQAAMEQMMSSMSGGAGGAAMGSIMSGAMGAGIGIGVCIMVVWAALKIGYFAWALIYFRKPHVRAWFDPSQASA